MLNLSNTLTKPEIMKISEISLRYPKNWVTIDITQRDKYGWPLKGKVLFNSQNKEEIIEKTQSIKGEDLYFFYTGCIDD